MAGEWIKVRTNLWDDPRVGKLVESTDTSEATIIGALYWLWATADEHSTNDGILHGMTLRTIDRKTGVQGFGAAMVAIDWLEELPNGVRLTRFDEHNGESAKTRAQTAKRVAKHKNKEGANAEVTQAALPEMESTVSDALSREEKIREEVKPTAKAKAETAPATRLPADWLPSESDVQFCRDNRPDLRPLDVADRFRDYWAAVPGTKGQKTSWSATWRNWVRNERRVQSQAPPGYQNANDKAKQWADKLTGKHRHEPSDEPTIIDINPAPNLG